MTKRSSWEKMALIMTPLFAMMTVAVLIVLGLPIKLPLTNIQTLFLGLALLAFALTFSSLAYKPTKKIVTQYGFDKELNPVFRNSLIRGTAVRDHLLVWAAIFGLMSFMYFFVGPEIWLLLIMGAFGTMSLDLLNDYLVLKKHSKPTQPNPSPNGD